MANPPPPIRYIDRTKAYYLALGYDNAYQWAHFSSTPFSRLTKPLEQCTVGVVTTAAPFIPEAGDQGPGAPYNANAKFFEVYKASTQKDPDLRISHVAIDRDNTTAEDINSYFPLKALKQAQRAGRIKAVAAHFFGLPTNRSIKTTTEIDCVSLSEQCLADNWDIAILVPNCPVCHQSVSLAARALESAGIVTAVMGCALDIVEHVGVPRFLFSDFPLGNACGKPNDESSQYNTLEQTFVLLETAKNANTTIESTQQWDATHTWKQFYSNPDLLTAEQLQQRRNDFDKAKNIAHSKKN